MFIIFLKFSSNKEKARDFMEAHMKWVQQGFSDGIFLLTGSIKPGLGGTVLVHNISLSELKKRVDEDPFVSEKIVSAEILEIDLGKVDSRFQFLASKRAVEPSEP